MNLKNFPKRLDSRTSCLRITVPDNLDLALEGLIRKVLREQPRTDDIYSFAANYFETLLKIRDRAGEKLTAAQLCPFHNDEDAHEMIKLAGTLSKPVSERPAKKNEGPPRASQTAGVKKREAQGRRDAGRGKPNERMKKPVKLNKQATPDLIRKLPMKSEARAGMEETKKEKEENGEILTSDPIKELVEKEMMMEAKENKTEGREKTETVENTQQEKNPSDNIDNVIKTNDENQGITEEKPQETDENEQTKEGNTVRSEENENPNLNKMKEAVEANKEIIEEAGDKETKHSHEETEDTNEKINPNKAEEQNEQSTEDSKEESQETNKKTSTDKSQQEKEIAKDVEKKDEETRAATVVDNIQEEPQQNTKDNEEKNELETSKETIPEIAKEEEKTITKDVEGENAETVAAENTQSPKDVKQTGSKETHETTNVDKTQEANEQIAKDAEEENIGTNKKSTSEKVEEVKTEENNQKNINDETAEESKEKTKDVGEENEKQGTENTKHVSETEAGNRGNPEEAENTPEKTMNSTHGGSQPPPDLQPEDKTEETNKTPTHKERMERFPTSESIKKVADMHPTDKLPQIPEDATEKDAPTPVSEGQEVTDVEIPSKGEESTNNQQKNPDETEIITKLEETTPSHTEQTDREEVTAEPTTTENITEAETKNDLNETSNKNIPKAEANEQTPENNGKDITSEELPAASEEQMIKRDVKPQESENTDDNTKKEIKTIPPEETKAHENTADTDTISKTDPDTKLDETETAHIEEDNTEITKTVIEPKDERHLQDEKKNQNEDSKQRENLEIKETQINEDKETPDASQERQTGSPTENKNQEQTEDELCSVVDIQNIPNETKTNQQQEEVEPEGDPQTEELCRVVDVQHIPKKEETFGEKSGEQLPETKEEDKPPMDTQNLPKEDKTDREKINDKSSTEQTEDKTEPKQDSSATAEDKREPKNEANAIAEGEMETKREPHPTAEGKTESKLEPNTIAEDTREPKNEGKTTAEDKREPKNETNTTAENKVEPNATAEDKREPQNETNTTAEDKVEPNATAEDKREPQNETNTTAEDKREVKNEANAIAEDKREPKNEANTTADVETEPNQEANPTANDNQNEEVEKIESKPEPTDPHATANTHHVITIEEFENSPKITEPTGEIQIKEIQAHIYDTLRVPETITKEYIVHSISPRSLLGVPDTEATREQIPDENMNSPTAFAEPSTLFPTEPTTDFPQMDIPSKDGAPSPSQQEDSDDLLLTPTSGYSLNISELSLLTVSELFMDSERRFSSLEKEEIRYVTPETDETRGENKQEVVEVMEKTVASSSVGAEPAPEEIMEEGLAQISEKAKEEGEGSGKAEGGSSGSSDSNGRSGEGDVPIISVEVRTVVETRSLDDEEEERPEVEVNVQAVIDIRDDAATSRPDVAEAETEMSNGTSQEKVDLNSGGEGFWRSGDDNRQESPVGSTEATGREGSSGETESTSSAATEIKRADSAKRNLSSVRSLLSTQSLDLGKRNPLVKTRSLSTFRHGVTDFEVWNTIEKELEDAAVKIQSKFRGYKTRKKLQRENAVQITTEESSMSTTPVETEIGTDEGQRSTGEFHDSIVLSEHPR